MRAAFVAVIYYQYFIARTALGQGAIHPECLRVQALALVDLRHGLGDDELGLGLDGLGRRGRHDGRRLGSGRKRTKPEVPPARRAVDVAREEYIDCVPEVVHGDRSEDGALRQRRVRST